MARRLGAAWHSRDAHAGEDTVHGATQLTSRPLHVARPLAHPRPTLSACPTCAGRVLVLAMQLLRRRRRARPGTPAGVQGWRVQLQVLPLCQVDVGQHIAHLQGHKKHETWGAGEMKHGLMWGG